MNILQWKNGDRTFFSLEVNNRLLLFDNVSSSTIFHSHLPRVWTSSASWRGWPGPCPPRCRVHCPLSVSRILNRFPFTARRLTRSWGDRGFAGLCITISISIRLVQRKSQKYCCTFLPLTDQLYSFTCAHGL